MNKDVAFFNGMVTMTWITISLITLSVKNLIINDRVVPTHVKVIIGVFGLAVVASELVYLLS